MVDAFNPDSEAVVIPAPTVPVGVADANGAVADVLT